MGMSTYVKGFRPPDATWQRMKAVYDACEAAGITPPDEVSDFFEWGRPDPEGVEVDIERTDSVQEWSDEYRSGFQVDVSKLPPGVTVVRVYNSY